jgi:DNA-binding NarL/FixJ family response regulator
MRARTSWCNIACMAFRVLIVDDNESFLDAARVLLEREHLHVAGIASTVADGLRGAEELRPQVVLVDIFLGRESGLDLARRLIERDSIGGLAVILVSTHAHEDVADLIADSPAVGFLSKSELSADAIRRVLSDGSR